MAAAGWAATARGAHVGREGGAGRLTMQNASKKVELTAQTEDGKVVRVWVWKDHLLEAAFELLREAVTTIVMRGDD